MTRSSRGGIERSLAHVEQLELVSMRVGDDGAQSDLDRKRVDHDSTARGDKPLDGSPDVFDKQIDSRVRPLVERNAGLEITDGKLQAIELAYERRVRRSTHERQSRSRTGVPGASGLPLTAVPVLETHANHPLSRRHAPETPSVTRPTPVGSPVALRTRLATGVPLSGMVPVARCCLPAVCRPTADKP